MPAENIVEVHHLKKSVGQGEHELSILTGVELVVKRGETIALVVSRDRVSQPCWRSSPGWMTAAVAK